MEELGLYVHIPFCEKKCHYCAFSSIPNAGEDQIEAYFNALLKEIENRRGIRCHVKTVYFGGGTPSFVPAEKIALTMKKLEDVFGFDALDPKMEKTIEVNPGSANAEKLSRYYDAGFNRLSVGLQAAQDHLLELTGRVHRVSDFSKTIKDAEKIGFQNISADLLFGLPEQRIEDIRESIDYLTSFKSIQHVSCYSLSVETGTIFEKLQQSGNLALPDDTVEREMYYNTCTQLEAHGLIQYEISNFAKKGFESRHNSAYWDLTPYIGLGTAAASYYHNQRWQNTANLIAYCQKISERHSAREDVHALSERERRGDYMFLGLRKTQGVKDSEYSKLFGSSFFTDYREEISQLIDQGLLIRHQDTIRLSKKGMDLANQVFMAFV